RERRPRAGGTRRRLVGRRHHGAGQRHARRPGAKRAADAIIEKSKAMASHLLEAAGTDLEFKEGKFTVAGTDRSIGMTDVAKAFYRPVGPTTKFGTGLDASGSSAAPPSFPNGCHACELEVDPE